MAERAQPPAALTPAPPEPRSLWGPIGATIFASLALAFSTCAISLQIDNDSISRVLWAIYAVFIGIFLCSIVLALIYFLIQTAKKVWSK